MAIYTFGGYYDEAVCKYAANILRKYANGELVGVVHARWIMDTDPDDGDCRCSNCLVCIDALHRRNHKMLKALGYQLNTFYKCCPNCGAKMDGVQKDGEQ